MRPLYLKIDHIGILAPAIESLVRDFRALGFTVVGPAELTTVNESGATVGLGQSSAHVMFRDDYIELTAVESTSADHHLAHFLQPPWGIRLLLLNCDDLDHVHNDCKARHLNPTDIQSAGRRIDYNEGAEAKFRWFGFPALDWPDALVAYVQHMTRELVFDASVSKHANGAKALTRLFYCADDLPGQYQQIAHGGGHSIELVTPESAKDVLGFNLGRTASFAGVGVGVNDIAATTTFLREANISVKTVNAGISVQLQSGTCLVFEQLADGS
jgi:hypothetical protein